MFLQLYDRLIDWPAVAARNRGPYVVEYDPRFPGGYYITTKKPPRTFICGDRRDMECLLENLIAVLGGYHPLPLASPEEASIFRNAWEGLLAVLLDGLNHRQEDASGTERLRFLLKVMQERIACRVIVDPRVRLLWK